MDHIEVLTWNACKLIRRRLPDIVCMFIQRQWWWNVTVIQALVALVSDPEPEHPLRADLAEEYTKDRKKFMKNAEDFTKKFGEKRPDAWICSKFRTVKFCQCPFLRRRRLKASKMMELLLHFVAVIGRRLKAFFLSYTEKWPHLLPAGHVTMLLMLLPNLATSKPLPSLNKEFFVQQCTGQC